MALTSLETKGILPERDALEKPTESFILAADTSWDCWGRAAAGVCAQGHVAPGKLWDLGKSSTRKCQAARKFEGTKGSE